jgi:hypothetical protein
VQTAFFAFAALAPRFLVTTMVVQMGNSVALVLTSYQRQSPLRSPLRFNGFLAYQHTSTTFLTTVFATTQLSELCGIGKRNVVLLTDAGQATGSKVMIFLVD